MSEPEKLRSQYAVRFTPHASREAIDALLRLDALEGEEIALQWYRGLRAAVGTLSDLPRRNAVAERESRLMRQEVRRLLYRRTPESSAAYHALYLIEEEDDGPRVIVFHIRHAARKPLTPREARDLREDVERTGEQR